MVVEILYEGWVLIRMVVLVDKEDSKDSFGL